jgi:RimJ/RimL family protein N-acetyltransferase
MLISTFPNLTTSRLSLRELSRSDAQQLFTVHSDADGMRWFGNDPMTDLAEADELLRVFAEWATEWFWHPLGYRKTIRWSLPWHMRAVPVEPKVAKLRRRL